MSIPTLDEQFLPRLIAVFYAVFHPTEGPKVIYQVPEGSITEDRTSPLTPIAGAPPPPSSGTFGGEPLFNFSALSEYLIPKAPLCGRLVTSIARGTVNIHPSCHSRPSTSRTPSVVPHHRARSSSVRSGNSSRASSRNPSNTTAGTREQRTYKILGFPVLIEDAGKYQRNNFIFNLCFVFEGHSDVRAYEPVVRKCGRVLRGLEETQSFLSNPKSLPRMYGIIEQLFEDLSSYCESFIALPDAPYTSYLDQKKGGASRMNSPEGGKLVNPVMGPEDFISLGASFASLRGEKERNAINERLKARQASKGGLGGGNAESGARSRSTSGSSDGGGGGGRVLSPLTTISPAMMVRSNNVSGASGPGSEGPHSPSSALSPTAMEGEGRRPSFARFSTIAALTDDGGAYPSEESRDTAMGVVSSRRQSELTRELSAAETLGNVLNNGAYDSINTVSGTRRSSRASTAHGIDPESESLEHLTESIVSLRTIDAALSNSVNALRTLPTDPTARTNLVEKREPPHGLGRTVRDAINLKLFPVYPNPAPINDWDVPVALLDLLSRVDGNWDLTLRRILPFIDGVNHVKRIAQLADADLGLTSACLEHLMYYGCIIVVDIFQYFNMYTVRPAMAKMADDEGLGRECRLYVTRAGYGMASWPELLRLYSLLRAGTTLADWVEDNAVDEKGIDVRRFVSFGVIQGFLRRVHRYPIYLGDAIGLGGGAAESSGMSTTVVNSPAIKQRENSGSREPRDRRPRELSGMSGAYSAFQRITRDGSVDSPGVGTRTPTRRGASEARSSMVATGSGSNFTDSVQVSPTKRTRQRQKYRHPTTTAVDVAAVAFQVDRPAGSSSGVNNPRSPRKRASAIGLTTAIPSTANLGGSASNSGIGIGVGTGAASSIYPRSTTQAIPPGLLELLDGTHSDDELCTTYSISWPELEKILIQIGLSHLPHRSDADTDEDDLASTQRSDWRRWPGASIVSAAGGVGGASSGWSGKGKMMSGISGVQGTRSGLSGAASSGGQGSSKHGGATQGGESSGFGVGVAGWGNDGDESGWVGAASGGGVVGLGALDREAIESGDWGAVRILYQ
ncbi:related to NPR2 - nitrogen permease regulator [Ustilago bromivora]|uniref:Related to NPR2 - nitrogen permease regulator n=1 Tax=Ustilago bromivora TaxID=307758 RepID=A0A8H8QRF0_9BASI|nr:related to NPR2 - nitrogen permease regulator [Ustilago bromivora]